MEQLVEFAIPCSSTFCGKKQLCEDSSTITRHKRPIGENKFGGDKVKNRKVVHIVSEFNETEALTKNMFPSSFSPIEEKSTVKKECEVKYYEQQLLYKDLMSQPPEVFVHAFLQVIDDHFCAEQFRNLLALWCDPEAVALLRNWSPNNPAESEYFARNPFGWYNFIELHGIYDILEHWRKARTISPDLHISSKVVRIVHGGGQTKAIVRYSCRGTSIIPFSSILAYQQSERVHYLHKNIDIFTSNSLERSMVEDLLSETMSFLYRQSVKLLHPKTISSNHIPRSSHSASKTSQLPLGNNSTNIGSCQDNTSLQKYLDEYYWEARIEGYIIISFNQTNIVDRIEFHYFDTSVNSCTSSPSSA